MRKPILTLIATSMSASAVLAPLPARADTRTRWFAEMIRPGAVSEGVRVLPGTNQFFSAFDAVHTTFPERTASRDRPADGSNGPPMADAYVRPAEPGLLPGRVALLEARPGGEARLSSLPLLPLEGDVPTYRPSAQLNDDHVSLDGGAVVDVVRMIGAPERRLGDLRESYAVQTDSSGRPWSVRLRVIEAHGRARAKSVTTDDGRGVRYDFAAQKDARRDGSLSPLTRETDYTGEIRLPVSDSGFVIYHRVDIAAQTLTVRTSSGKEYVYDLGLTGQPGRHDQTYNARATLREDSPRNLTEAELRQHRPTASAPLGVRQVVGPGEAAHGLRFGSQAPPRPPDLGATAN